jgi:translocation and assembly module TamB
MLKWFAWLVLLVLIIICAAAGYLLGTEGGSNALLKRVQTMYPGLVSIQSSQGDLLSRLELEGVKLDWGRGQLRVARLVLEWSPAALWRKQVLVNEISAVDVIYRGQPPADETPPEPLQWPIELPVLSLPVDLIIQQLAISNATIRTAPDATPIQVDQADLQAHWDANGIAVENLLARGPQYHIALNGQVDPRNDYALQLNNQVELTLPNEVAITLAGSVEGSTRALSLQQQLDGAARLRLNGQLKQPLVDPTWQATIDIEELPGSLFTKQLTLLISGQLAASGGLHNAQVNGELATSSQSADYDALLAVLDLNVDWQEERLRVSTLQLTQAQRPLRLTVQGVANAAQEIDLTATWQSLQWPLAGDVTIGSESGEISVQGPLDGYQLEASAQLYGEHIPPGIWTLSGGGNREQLQLQGVQGMLLNGTAQLKGLLAWAPAIKWDLALDGKQLQPGQFWPNMAGTVNLAASSQGHIDEDGPKATVTLQQLGGSLNGQPLRGTGDIAYTPQLTRIDKLTLGMGDASLRANGSIGPQSNLQWQVDVPQFKQLVPDASGQLSGKGTLDGPQQTLHIIGAVDARGIGYNGLAVEQFSANIDVDLQDKQRSTVAINGTNLGRGEQRLQSINLNVDGFIREHSISLSASHPQGLVELAAKGGYADTLWNGTLKRLLLNTRQLGDWRTRQAVDISAGPASASAKKLCLQREQASLCGQGTWKAQGKSTGDFAIADLPLEWFATWFPATIVHLDGELSATGNIAYTNALVGSLNARVTPGELELAGTGENVRMPHTGAELMVETRGQGARAAVKTSIGTTVLDADVQLANLLQVDDPLQASLRGRLQLKAPDLAIVPLLVPAVSKIDGNIDADFTIAGRLGQPLLQGGALIAVPLLELEQLGLQFSDTQIDLGVANNALLLDGHINSDGRIDLQGKLALDAEKDWPFEMHVTGKNFVVTDLPNIRVLADPDLHIHSSSAGLALTGSLHIPKADIRIRELPAGARTASSDVIVLDREQPGQAAAQSTPLAINVDVSLADKVQVAALGFKGYVAGKVNVRAKPGKPPLATGDIRIDEGTFSAYGQRLQIQRGLISYTKSPIDNPGLNVRAIREIGDVVVGVNVLGTARRTTVNTFSTPAMSENNRISYLVTGKAANEGALLSLDREIAPNLSVGVNVDTQTGESIFVTRYRILRTLHVEAGSSARSSTLDLYYTFELE